MLNRREFLTVGFAAGVAFTLEACLPNLPPKGRENFPIIPWYIEYMNENEIVEILDRIKNGAQKGDQLTRMSASFLENLHYGTSEADEFSGLAESSFLFLRRRDNIFSSEAIASRPNKLRIRFKGNPIEYSYIESFWPGIGIPLAYLNYGNLSDQTIAIASSKELVSLGMIDGISRWLQGKSEDFDIHLKGNIIANSRTAVPLQREQVGLTIFFANTTRPDPNNDIWWTYDTLPLLTVASGLNYSGNYEATNEIPTLQPAIDYLYNETYNNTSLIDTFLNRFYAPLWEGKTIRTNPETLIELLNDVQFRKLISDFNK